jgi:transketolase
LIDQIKNGSVEEINELSRIASQLRRDVLRMCHGAQSGHPGGSLGCSDLMSVLYFKILDLAPGQFAMDGRNEDIFLLSNGHISPVFYAVLARRSFFPVQELSSFRKINSRLQGHPTPHDRLPGVRIASGSLGQGLSVAIGAALSKKLNKDKKLVYVLCGDGEMQEGQNWEALMFAAHHQVDNMIAIMDYNRKQIDGSLEDVMCLGNIKSKIESFGWICLEMDGNNIKDSISVIEKARASCFKGKPLFIIMKTVMGSGVDFMENDHTWHGVSPNDEELEKALKQIKESIGDY